jgi:hypothetical protein
MRMPLLIDRSAAGHAYLQSTAMYVHVATMLNISGIPALSLQFITSSIDL